MRVALVADAEHARHERAALNRTAIGLLGEGCSVVRLAPPLEVDPRLEPTEARLALVTRYEIDPGGMPWRRRARARTLATTLQRRPPDVLIAAGSAGWRFALDLAAALECPVALELTRAEQLRRLPHGAAAERVAAFLAPTEAIARALRARVEPELVALLPPGVSIPSEPREPLADAERSIALAIVIEGRDLPACRAALGGIGRVVREYPQIHAFLELPERGDRELWALARRLDLLRHLSTLGDAAEHRSLLVHCDVLLVPERTGTIRSIVYEAMAAGLPIVASRDETIDDLEEGATALLVDRAEPDAWANAIRRLVSDPDAAQRLGAQARARAIAAHRDVDRARRLAALVGRIVRGDATPFAVAAAPATMPLDASPGPPADRQPD